MPTLRQSLAATAAASLALCACGDGEGETNAAANAANAAQQTTVPQLPIPALEAPLDREKLLVAAMYAASDFVTGADDEQRQDDLADKKFEFRFRFGCAGPGSDESEKAFDWTLNKKTGALKVRATPKLSPKDAPVEAIAGESFETVEGFWVPQPWLLAATCPKAEADNAQPVAPTKQADDQAKASADSASKKKKPSKTATGDQGEAPAAPAALSRSVGIAQFFTATGPRTLRRSGRPYQATKRLQAGEEPTGGFDLVISGRLAPLPDGRVIACTRAASGERPSCVISVEFGKVAIERADTHEQIAQWGSG